MSMSPLATLEDLTVREIPVPSPARATALLAEASGIVRAEVRGIDAKLASEPPTLDLALVVGTVCNMVRRALQANELAGVEQMQRAAGPFSTGFTFANPAGDLYLTKAERRRLRGQTGSVARTVYMGLTQ